MEWIRLKDLAAKFRLKSAHIARVLNRSGIETKIEAHARFYEKELAIKIVKEYLRIKNKYDKEGWYNRHTLVEKYGAVNMVAAVERARKYPIIMRVGGVKNFYHYNLEDYLCVSGADKKFCPLNIMARVCGCSEAEIIERAIEYDIDIIAGKVDFEFRHRIFRNKKRKSNYGERQKYLLKIEKMLKITGKVHNPLDGKTFIFNSGKHYFDCRFRHDATMPHIEDVPKIKKIIGGYIENTSGYDGILKNFYVVGYGF